jgi:hypothetical protein
MLSIGEISAVLGLHPDICTVIGSFLCPEPRFKYENSDRRFLRLMRNLESSLEDHDDVLRSGNVLIASPYVLFVNVNQDIRIYGARLRSVTDKLVSFYVFADHWELARVHTLIRERCEHERHERRGEGSHTFKAISPVKSDDGGAYIQFKREWSFNRGTIEYQRGSSRRRFNLLIDIRGLYVNSEAREVGISWRVMTSFHDDGPPEPKIKPAPKKPSSASSKPPFLMLPSQPQKPSSASSKEKKPPFLMLPGSSQTKKSTPQLPSNTPPLCSPSAQPRPPRPHLSGVAPLEGKKQQDHIQRVRHPSMQVPQDIKRPKRMGS